MAPQRATFYLPTSGTHSAREGSLVGARYCSSSWEYHRHQVHDDTRAGERRKEQEESFAPFYSLAPKDFKQRISCVTLPFCTSCNSCISCKQVQEAEPNASRSIEGRQEQRRQPDRHGSLIEAPSRAPQETREALQEGVSRSRRVTTRRVSLDTNTHANRNKALRPSLFLDATNNHI